MQEDVEFLHGDPGLTNDAFTLCLCHRLPRVKTLIDADGTEKTYNHVVVDFVLGWKPRPEVPVDLLNIEETILKIADIYNVSVITYDRWNSAESIQRLFAAGILSYDQSFSQSQQLAMYRNLKLLIYNDLIELPQNLEMLRELKLLKLKNDKIPHDVAGKDRADAVAAAVWAATGEGETEVQRLVRETLGTSS